MWTIEKEHEGNPGATDHWDAVVVNISPALWFLGIRTIEEA